MTPAEAAAEAAAATSSGRVEAAGRMSSMEWEPKTLTLDQIKFAREAALYVVSTKTEQEAIRIFTEGLKPVQTAAAAVRKSSFTDSSSDDDVDLGGGSSGDYSSSTTKQRCCGGSKGRRRGGHPGRRRCGCGVDDERDVATAPF